jgi:hypothetical protein
MTPKYASYRDIETAVLIWGDARKITSNGKSVGQAKKTVEEANELLAACLDLAQLTPGSEAHTKVLEEAKDAIGDVLVTLVMCAERLTRETGHLVDVIQCFSGAYDQIKHRTGHLNPDGVFVKYTISV